MAKTNVFGLNENLASALSYALLFFSGIVILVMERENKTVRFHALQSTIWFLFISILSWVVGWFAAVPLVGGLISGVLGMAIGIVWLASWLYLMYTAITGRKFKIPMVGDVVEAQINK